ncbi:MAG: hypothetical protein OK436_02355 [Thaumarchaeota archaeon]|nr:hypothetical protein [Nitrososphaerota archaeon]
MQVEQNGPKDSVELLENFDVEEAVRIVLSLAEGLIEATTQAKHRFRSDWVDQLVSRYRQNPGKPVIHLSDLPDQVIPNLSKHVNSFLQPYWETLAGERGSEWASQHFRCVWGIMKTGKASRWSSLLIWRRFCQMTGFNLDDLESFVVGLRASGTGTSRVILNPILPFRLATVEGAKLFGYRGDTAYETSALINKEPALHADYRHAVSSTVSDVLFTTSVIHEGGVDRTNVGVFVTILTTIGGLDNSKKQKIARNPLPSWLFCGEKEVAKSCQRSLWEAEGSPTRDALKLGQSVHCPNLQTTSWPSDKRKIKISFFPESIRKLIMESPPPLLVSAALLLFKFGIVSYLAPLGAGKTRDGISATWMLYVYRTRNMRKFERDIGFFSSTKRKKLVRMNALHRPRKNLADQLIS